MFAIIIDNPPVPLQPYGFGCSVGTKQKYHDSATCFFRNFSAPLRWKMLKFALNGWMGVYFVCISLSVSTVDYFALILTYFQVSLPILFFYSNYWFYNRCLESNWQVILSIVDGRNFHQFLSIGFLLICNTGTGTLVSGMKFQFLLLE